MDNDDFVSDHYTQKVTQCNDGWPPIIEYFDKEGNNVTPIPLHSPDEDEQEKLAEDPQRKLKRPPRKNTIMRTFLHVTTALYSMAGLGSLEQSRAFLELSKQASREEGGGESEDEERKYRLSKEIQDLNLESEDPFCKEPTTTTKKQHDVSLPVDKRHAHLPDSLLALKADHIDVLLVETDTIWMLELLGTCVEVNPDAPPPTTTTTEEATKKAAETDQNVSRYERVESWTQTLDFSKKKKGTQCEEVELGDSSTQVSTKNFFQEAEKERKNKEAAAAAAAAVTAAGTSKVAAPWMGSVAYAGFQKGEGGEVKVAGGGQGSSKA